MIAEAEARLLCEKAEDERLRAANEPWREMQMIADNFLAYIKVGESIIDMLDSIPWGEFNAYYEKLPDSHEKSVARRMWAMYLEGCT